MSVVLDILAEIILAISFYQEKFSCLDQKDIHQEYLQMHFYRQVRYFNRGWNMLLDGNWGIFGTQNK